jgi:hypothetical protein
MTPPSDSPQGDMVFENAILSMHDALISQEFTDAIKCGDSGCVILVLKIWALSFHGNGRTNMCMRCSTLFTISPTSGLSLLCM